MPYSASKYGVTSVRQCKILRRFETANQCTVSLYTVAGSLCILGNTHLKLQLESSQKDIALIESSGKQEPQSKCRSSWLLGDPCCVHRRTTCKRRGKNPHVEYAVNLCRIRLLVRSSPFQGDQTGAEPVCDSKYSP